MKMNLENIGIITNSTVLLEGLTVITGKNNSGKTTVGKILYSTIQANSDLENAFEESKTTYISAQLDRMWRTLAKQWLYVFSPAQRNKHMTGIQKVIYLLGNERRKNTEVSTVETLYQVRNVLKDLSFNDFARTIESLSDGYEYWSEGEPDSFEQRKSSALEICDKTIKIIENPNAFDSFRKKRMQDFINDAFHNQVQPVRSPGVISHFSISDEKTNTISIEIRNKRDYKFNDSKLWGLLYDRAIFVDNPFSIDETYYSNDGLFARYSFGMKDYGGIESVSIPSYNDELRRLLRIKASDNFFDTLDFQSKYHDVIEKINKIVPGEFTETNDGIFYSSEGVLLDVQNMATGSKMFFIIKLLLMNGHLDEHTVLILDEPESHLHPEWINEFANILILLIKEIGMHVLLTTHSPNLLLALDVYSKEYELKDKSHFYLAEKLENSWKARLTNIDDNISAGYAHLALPLLQMNALKNQSEEDE